MKRVNVIGSQNLFAGANDSVKTSANARASAGLTAKVVAQITKSDRWPVLGYGYREDNSTADSATWYALRDTAGQTVYVRKDKLRFYEITSPTTYTERNLNTFLSDCANVDKSIYLRLLQCAELIRKAAAKGVSVAKYRQQLITLNNRLAARQQAFATSKLLKVKNAFNSAWTAAYKVYKNVLNGTGIGASPIIISAIAVAIVAVGGVSAWAVYQQFKPRFTEATTDLHQSELLKKALESLTSEEKNDVVNDLERQIDDAYKEGENSASFSSALKLFGVIAGGVAVVYMLTKNKKNG